MMFAAAAAAAILASAVARSASPVVGGAQHRPPRAICPPSRDFSDKNNLPTTGQDWISLGDQVRFWPRVSSPTTLTTRIPRPPAASGPSATAPSLSWGTKDYSTQFIDGGETYYDEYSQAWRLLGFYIDCDSPYERRG